MITNQFNLKIVIISYSDHQQTAINGLIDLFNLAEYACNSFKKIQVKVISNDHDFTNFLAKQDVIIIPPCMSGIHTPDNIGEIINFIRHHHSQQSIIAAICVGTFILAETGLLNGKEATTHWLYADTLKKKFPKIIVNKSKLLVDNETLITSGGIMSWVDIGLYIVEKFFGHHIMLKTTQFMNVDPPRDLQNQYMSFFPKLDHNDTAILKAQYWLMNADIHDINVKNLVIQSGLEERTFLRRFKKATKLLPKNYIQNFCIEYAKGLLETTDMPIEQISWNLGYANSSSFRKNFTKITCLTPRDYRNKYKIRSR